MITVLFRDVITLTSITKGKDEEGNPVNTQPIKRDVFADKKSVRSNEFYLASQQGRNLAYMFIVRSVDYNQETILEFEGKPYNIFRFYDTGEFTELVCQAQK